MPNNDDTQYATTIESYLRGKVATTIPDNTLTSIELEVGVEPGTEYMEMTEKQRDLCLAGLYVWLSTNPSQTGTVRDEDADWSHSEGGQVYSASALNNFLRMANAIYKKYGLTTVGSNSWGMRGSGFHNIRNYGNPFMK